MAKETVGTIHDKDALFLWQDVGTIEDGENKYEVTVLSPLLSPIVKSEQSGKYFSLDWQAIVRLAIDAGIDK